jgi:hypothetical protein
MTTPGDVRSFAHTGTNSGPSIRGTGSSNPFRSATQSSIYGILWRDERNPRVCGLPRLLKVPGESTIGAFFGRLHEFLSASR